MGIVLSSSESGWQPYTLPEPKLCNTTTDAESNDNKHNLLLPHWIIHVVDAHNILWELSRRAETILFLQSVPWVLHLVNEWAMTTFTVL